MKEEGKTKEKLAHELAKLRRRITELEASNAEHKQAEKELKVSEKRYRNLVEHATDAIYIISSRGFEYVNSAFEKLTGFKAEEVYSEDFNFWSIIAPEDRELIKQRELARKRGERIPSRYEFRVITRYEAVKNVEATTVQIGKKGEVRVMGILRDITGIKQAEEKIRASLKEKELLLKEIHHRVKNNIQVITSLLSLQSMHFKDKLALEMFKSTMNRVKSMGLVHERLYKSDDLAKIDFDQYIRELATYLFQSYNVDSTAVKIKIDVKDVFIDINTAVPCALIITELLSNSLKYAFPDGKAGEILLDFQPLRDGEYSLIIRDNGVEFPEDIDFRKTKSLGLQLVNMLVDQLHGTIRLKRAPGTEFTIAFKEASK